MTLGWPVSLPTIRCTLARGLIAGLLLLTAATGSANELEYTELRNRLFQHERALAVLSQSSTMPAAERTKRADKIQGEIRRIRDQVAGKFGPADMALGTAIDAVQKYGSAWFLTYLSQGRFTGRKAEFHKPLEGVDIPSKHAQLAGRAALPLMGYPLMVILSYDPITREAYREFIGQLEDVVRDMERRAGKPLEFFDRAPTVIPNDVGWDVDRFWNCAQTCADRVVQKYFWNSSPDEVRQARNIVALILCAGLMNNVTIDVEGDKETQSKKAFWRANAAPWFSADKTKIRHKFHIFHLFTHAWLTYLKLINDTRFDKGILTFREQRPTKRFTLKNAFWFSNAVGFTYEAISTFTGTKHGFLETTVVQQLPRPLKKVAQMLHLKNIVGFEAASDIIDNRDGAWFGSALFLSNAPLTLSRLAEHRAIVESWQKNLPEKGDAVQPARGGPAQGLPACLHNGQVSLLDLNTPAGKKRINSGFFRQVYRGMGAFEPSAHAAAELQAFKHLLGEDIMSYNLRQLYNANFSNFETSDQAWKAAKQQHAGIIQRHFSVTDPMARSPLFHDLFSNEGNRIDPDSYNHEADYIYATRRADIAGCYGPIVLTIQEKTPRGLDLNPIAREYRYYSAARFLKNSIKGRWKTLLGDYLLDDEEYLLPSYVTSSEVVGFLARSPRAKVVKTSVAAADKDFAIAFKAPPVLRAYEKRMIGGYLVIDVFDADRKLITRLSESIDHTPVADKTPLSAEKLPDAIQSAWKQYLSRKT
jgi:hypothetical protein